MEESSKTVTPFHENVNLEDPFTPDLFYLVENAFEDDVQYAFHSEHGSITVLDRMTGFGWRDVETGYRDIDGTFWLASGNLDVRESGCSTIREAIQWVKDNSNTCKGVGGR